MPADARPPMIQAALAQTVGQHIAILVLHTPHAAGSDAAQALVRRIRAERTVADARVLVTGHTAVDLDFTGLVRNHAPRAVAVIVAAAWLAPFWLLGSLLLAILAAVFCGFALADLVVIKAIGIGMGIAVVVDATVVRMLLVPATMRLLGRWNWWAPEPLARWRARIAP